VLGVPSNDFGAREPGTEGQIKAFCETTFGIDVPVTREQRVSGRGAHPLHRWAAAATGPQGVTRWDFHKPLIGRDGRLTAWSPTAVPPGSSRRARTIDAALARPAATPSAGRRAPPLRWIKVKRRRRP